ncbi:MAG: pyridoxal-phosphate dependent enzyme [Bacteroidota bacterium]|nr:pyridoxal-phosphate dependent enzyme [Bacteroidota bacterium]
MISSVDLNKIFVQSLKSDLLMSKSITAAVLRIDELHPVISGNKWFKLKYYLEDAVRKGFGTIVTFGGAYSNHIAATAFACKEARLKSVGIIRGEEPANLSHTLQQASLDGMQLIFVSRNDFKEEENIKAKFFSPDWYWINTGGYGMNGAKGAAEIFNWIDDSYTHILCATGTGTMMAGLIKAAKKHQTVIGINSMKNKNLIDDIKNLLTIEELNKNFILLNEYHFGGFAKHPVELINFMKDVWQQYQLPTDIVYTSKLLFATVDLIEKNYFEANSKLMIIHSGGLQGNLSLPLNSLPF